MKDELPTSNAQRPTSNEQHRHKGQIPASLLPFFVVKNISVNQRNQRLKKQHSAFSSQLSA
ncbi:MAG: hypothetical protein ACYC54_01785 [Sedimentisphaerales bacterium]